MAMPDDTVRLGDTYPPFGTMRLIEQSVVLLLVGGVLLGVLTVLWPFTTAILFGATLAIATWPLRQAMIGWGLGRGLTATLLLVLSLLIIALPVLVMAPVLTDQLTQGMQSVQNYLAEAPAQPAWLTNVPFVGGRLGQLWDQMLRAGGDLGAVIAPYTGTIRQMLLMAAHGFADSVVALALSLIVATMFWMQGATLVEQLHDILGRLGGPTAETTLDAAAGAVLSVAYGVIGTAAIQAVLLTLGLALAGVPGATTLGFVGLLLAISQIGAPLLLLIWGGAAWWLFDHDAQGWGAFMIVWGLLISMIDNFLKPWLIGLGVHMPMSLTILGVFGGFIAYGFLGLFIGPTLIAVAFILLQAWRAHSPGPNDAAIREIVAPPASPPPV
jgi:predicted PurR-regulated permease PerM